MVLSLDFPGYSLWIGDYGDGATGGSDIYFRIRRVVESEASQHHRCQIRYGWWSSAILLLWLFLTRKVIPPTILNLNIKDGGERSEPPALAFP
jgi:hypothetical protein